MDPNEAREILVQTLPRFKHFANRMFRQLPLDERDNIAAEAIFLLWRQMTQWDIKKMTPDEVDEKINKSIYRRTIDAFFRIRGGVRIVKLKSGRVKKDYTKVLNKAASIESHSVRKTGEKDIPGIQLHAEKTDWDIAASRLVRDAVEVLPQDERLVFALAVIGKNPQQIGEMMGFSASRAFQLLDKARKTLIRRNVVPPLKEKITRPLAKSPKRSQRRPRSK